MTSTSTFRVGDAIWRVEPLAGGRWLGVCEQLGLSMEGDSALDLHVRIGDAMALHAADIAEAEGSP